jgi:colicin import membrane protein
MKRAKIEDEFPSDAVPSTDLAVVETNPVALVTDKQQFDNFYTSIRAAVMAHVPDLTTKTGRDAVKSLAFKVVKSKTALDEAGKRLTEEARDQIAKVDAARRDIRTRLDALRDEVRAPLDAWEAEEAARLQEIEHAFDTLHRLMVVRAEDTADLLSSRVETLGAWSFPAEIFRDKKPEILELHALVTVTLGEALARLRQEEADRAEFAALRAANAERVRLAEEAAAEQQRIADAQAAEADRLEREKAEAERKAEEAAEQARRVEAARAEAGAHAAADAKRREAEHAAAIKAAVIEGERKAKAAAAEAARLEKEAADRAARDKANRAQKIGGAEDALVALGLTKAVAHKIVLAIVAETVPNVSLRF